MARLGKVSLCLVLVVAVIASGTSPARAFAPAAPLVPPLIGGSATGTATATGAAGIGVAGVASGVIVPVAIGTAVGVGVVLAWDRLESGTWAWEDEVDPEQQAIIDAMTSGGSESHAGVKVKECWTYGQVDTQPCGTSPRDHYWTTYLVDIADTVNSGARLYSIADDGSAPAPLSSEDQPVSQYAGQANIYINGGPVGDTLDAAVVELRICAVSDCSQDPKTFSVDNLGSDPPAEPTVEATATFTRPDGTTYTKTVTEPYDPEASEHTYPEVPADDPKDRISELDVIRNPDEASIEDETLLDWQAPNTWNRLDTEFPDCNDGSCELALYVATDTGVENCDANEALCAGWASHPDRDARYECRWGPYTLALNQCKPLIGVYQGEDTKKVTGPQPDLDQQPDGGMLQRLFTPQRTKQQTMQLQQTWTSRPPGSVAASLGTIVEGIYDGWTGAAGDCSQFPTVLDDTYFNPADGRLPCTPPSGGGTWGTIYGAVQVALGVGTVILLWGMVSRSMGQESV